MILFFINIYKCNNKKTVNLSTKIRSINSVKHKTENVKSVKHKTENVKSVKHKTENLKSVKHKIRKHKIRDQTNYDDKQFLLYNHSCYSVLCL